MKVVNVNRLNAVLGGKERYIHETRALLAQHGHSAIDFCMAERQTVSSPYQSYFPPRLNVDSPHLLERAQAAVYRLHNPQSAAALGRLLDAEPVDVAHIHSHHHMSSSVLKTLAERRVPIVWTLHDYQAICPVATLFTQGEVCVRCRHHHYFQAVLHRCSLTGLAGSLVSAADSAWLNLSGALATVDRFIAPSDFMARMAVDFGLPRDKIVTLNYYAPVDKWKPRPPAGRSGSLLFAGRLYRLKGAHVLLAALGKLHLPATQRVVIVGNGPEMPALQRQARELGLDHVEFTGHLQDEGIREQIEACRFTVVPSIWYEVLGFAILEPFAVGRPVIGARIGGIPEVIVHGETGRLCNPNDVDDLAAQIDWMLTHPAEADEMGQAARQRAETLYSPAEHYRRLMDIYGTAIRSHAR